VRFLVPAVLVVGLIGGALVAPAPAAVAVAEEQPGDAVIIDDPQYADAAQLEVSGTLQVVEADVPVSAKGVALAPDVESSTYLLTDTGESIQLEGGLPDGATSGATLEGTLALTDEASAELGVEPEVVDAASTEPLPAESAESMQILSTATTENVAMPVAAATITQPATVAAAALTHSFYVAVVVPQGSSVKGSSFSDTKVRSLVSTVSKYWKSQSNSVINGVSLAKITRFTSSTSCAGRSTSVHTWWSQAGAKFSDNPNVFFGAGTGRHLVVLNPDGSSAQGACARKLGFTGLGTVGSSSSDGGRIMATVGSSLGAATVAHEFGHNISLGHANVAVCTSETVAEAPGTGCGVDEYWDLYDIMGATVVGQKAMPALSLPAKDRLGFLPDGDVLTAESDGQPTTTFTQVIRPISGTSGSRGIHVTDPVSGASYWIEYRNGSAQDAGLLANRDSFKVCALTCKTSFTYAYGDGVRVLAQDTSRPNAPETLAIAMQDSAVRTHRVRALALDSFDTFSSASGGVHVDVDWVTPAAASVTVTLTSAPTLLAADKGMALGGYAVVGRELTAVGQYFRQVGVNRSYQWLRDGAPIAGAISSRYTPTGMDATRSVSVAVTGSLPGFAPATIESYAVTIAASGSSAATAKAPVLIATPATNLGGGGVSPYVIAYTGKPGSGSVSLRWTAPASRAIGTARVDEDGVVRVKIPWRYGAVDQTIRATTSDGRSAAQVTVRPGQLRPTLKLALSASTAKKTSAVKATVSFATATWFSHPPTGTVDIYEGDTLIATKTLSKSKATFTLPLFTTTGKKTLHAVYSGDTHFVADDSTTRAVTIR